MSSPDLTNAEIAAVNQVLQTSSLSIGPHIARFERTFAEYIGTNYAIGVNSGTSGLHLCIIAAGVGEGDMVITTPFSFIASANCILYERGIPIFVDVDPITGNIDPLQSAEAAAALRENRSPTETNRWMPPNMRTVSRSKGHLKALIPVHTFGSPSDMDPLLALARQHNLKVIEDACEAIGSEYQEHKVGTMSDAAVFAFYPNKQMTTGEGGMIVTTKSEWNTLFRSLRNQGRDMFNAWLDHNRLGYNYRLDEMSAALGLVQLQRINELIAKRSQVAAWYHERLSTTELVECPIPSPTTNRMSWFVYVIRILPPANRDEVMRRLADKGIPSRPYFTPIHLQSFYRKRFGYQRGDFPVTEYLGDVSLALPFSSTMTEDQVDEVCEHLQTIVSQSREKMFGLFTQLNYHVKSHTQHRNCLTVKTIQG
jgi:dTDP-4-amino-4,6-dideoxygalactose transaminase